MGLLPPAVGPDRPRRRASVIRDVLRDVRAVVLDTDGVITDSARVHAEAWKRAFDTFLAEHPPDLPAYRRDFDIHEDYFRYVDGKSRLDGAAAFMASRGLRLRADAVEAVAADKDRLYVERLRKGRIAAYPGTVRLLHELRGAGIPLAAASASRHARELLLHAGVLPLFDALVDGAEAARLRLPGKPDPALFQEAARRLGARAADAAVVEDALAGVEAGRRGGFRVVIGVDRNAAAGTRASLLRHGADIVVDDLAELVDGGEGP
ncbi:HAD family hydrolase [Streptomyces longisporoflavus]|uniref:HAD family hydrolase n=1 Tax=Streptomyces longisporoflavus TaxID=28044 RepID=A0ABW7R152_9ACTN